MGKDAQVALASRLRSVPPVKVARQVRAALRDGRTDAERINLITEVLDEAGIVAPPAREPLPHVQAHEVRLIAWLAVRGTRE